MAKRSIVLQKKNALAPDGRQGLERHRRASTRLSLVGLRPRNPDSVSPSANDDIRGPLCNQAVQECTSIKCNEEKVLMKTL